ncbi:hypothetical protein LTR12_010721 [Friedmanniomyces endolithicus]|nr:hypothetical protein LTR12_010721 [Friedmanniomyces endolithicus]
MASDVCVEKQDSHNKAPSSSQQTFLTDHITLHDRPTITPHIRTTGRTTEPGQHQRTPSPTPSTPPDSDFLRLQHLIILPETAFTPANPFHKQLWAASLSAEELRTLLVDAQGLLEHAIRIKSDALRAELEKLEKLEERFAEGVTSPMREEVEDMKGDICAAMLQRWGLQRDV